MSPNPPSREFNFIEGEILLIDKPSGWTSFDVVNKIRGLIRRKLGVKKIKVGHAGTLDPLATGLLIVCTGKMTRKIHTLMDLDKEYTGTIRFGATTPSFDAETSIDHEYPVNHITEEKLQDASRLFLGETEQVPPVYSAKKVEGKRAYRYARENREIKLEPVRISIHEFELTGIAMPEISFRVVCSKGTYVRSLARDLGIALDSGAYLLSLRRTRIGTFDVDDAITPEQFEKLINPES